MDDHRSVAQLSTTEPVTSTSAAVAPTGMPNELGPILIPLLKGVIYRETDQTRWTALQRLQTQVRDYVRVLGLELFVDDAEGYAFLRSIADDETAEGGSHDARGEPLPRLVVRRPLSFNVSLLLALLRRRLAEADTAGGDTRLVLSRSEIVDILAVFQPDATNEVAIVRRVEADITKITELGFLHRVGANTRRGEEPRYEVRRILKAFVDAQWLTEFNTRLHEYRVVLAHGGRPEDTEREAGDVGDVGYDDE